MSFINNIPQHIKGEDCPACNASDKPKGGVLIECNDTFGRFIRCDRYPLCKYTFNPVKAGEESFIQEQRIRAR